MPPDRSGWPASWAGTAPKPISRRATCFWRLRSSFPDAIAGRARRYNFASDASHRFERGVDFDNNIAGIERATQLILEICGGEPGPVVDTIARLPERKPVRMRVSRAQRIIGVPIPADEMAGVFTRLGMQCKREGQRRRRSVSSSRRRPTASISQIEEDLIEEVARVHGFENIPANPPRVAAIMRSEPETRRSLHALRASLAAADYQEVINFSFVEPAWEADFAGNAQPIRLLNPIASQLSVMRSSLIGGLVANVRYNLNRRATRCGYSRSAVHSCAQPTAPDGPLDVAGVRQPVRVAAAAFGPAAEEQWGIPRRAGGFLRCKGRPRSLAGAVQPPASSRRRIPHCTRGAPPGYCCDGTSIGWIGELHPRWQQKYELPGPMVLFEVDAEPLQAVRLPKYREVSKFPAVSRDIAVILPDDVSVQSMLDDLAVHKPEQVADVHLFDLYRGPGVENGKKSLAFRVLLQDTQKTLTDPEVESAVAELGPAVAWAIRWQTARLR